ncbi:MerR family transcriptional regulator [Halospina denitrificans]|uniref:MerR family transcriptional regulator n=1 Tax=Halospina denitrificans TaxID=332522 RepID=A0A4R7JWI5_9GAMM|nr:MerR family DNA-binding transcriptional regulator [Halospina denitrificans]TDT41379.1 MerR family transcriptional regulator [Halospina denitrificans]
MNREKTYGIGELARDFDVTTRTIRFYEEAGLLSPAREGQQRVYTDADRVKLKLILRGKRLGFSLSESRDLIEMYDPESGNSRQLNALLSKIQERREQLNEQMREIELMQVELEEAEKRCLDAFDR